MEQTLHSVRGMRDWLPPLSHAAEALEGNLVRLAKQRGYHPMRMPIVELSQLFERAVGEDTDIVSKEMFCFDDKNGDRITLRPEGTASCVRAGLNAGLLHNQCARWYYHGPMFRRERPQKGRHRQFYQVGLEAFGMASPTLEVELIEIVTEFFKYTGLVNEITLKLNSIGSTEARRDYTKALRQFFDAYRPELDEMSLMQLKTNPLRLLDSKLPVIQAIASKAPKLSAFLSEEDRTHFDRVKTLLDQADIGYELDERLVRGLDYYNRTVFEWVGSGLGAQSTVCGGGRYDGLVAHLGGKPTPAAGFALGLDRVLLMLEQQSKLEIIGAEGCLISVIAEADVTEQAEAVARALRRALGTGYCVSTSHGAQSIAAQIKAAQRSQAHYLCEVKAGPDNASPPELILKTMEPYAVERVSLEELIAKLKEEVGQYEAARDV